MSAPTPSRRTAADLRHPKTDPQALIGGHADIFSPNAPALRRKAASMFDAWIAHRAVRHGPGRQNRKLSAASIAMYAELWTPFAEYCALQDVDPSAITDDELKEYLLTRRPRTPDRRALHRDPGKRSAPEISARHGFRILALIDKVLRLHARDQGVEPNLAADRILNEPPYSTVNAQDKAGAPSVLTGKQIHALKVVCRLKLNDEPNAPQTWGEVRDNSAVLLQLATGITPLEVRRLRLVDVEIDEATGYPSKLSIGKTDTFPARQVPIAFAEAARQLAYWLRVRDSACIEGDYLFPSTSKGTQWSEESQLQKTRLTLERAGLGHLPGGSYRLRHTYILRQMKLSRPRIPHDQLAALVGIKEVDEMVARYIGLPIE